MLYNFIQQVGSQFPVQLLCKIFHISRSAYYAYKVGKTYQMSQQQIYQSAEVKKPSFCINGGMVPADWSLSYRRWGFP
jgi:hypothetical protein